MPHKRITRRIPNLPPLAVRRPCGAIEVLIDCSTDGTEGCAWGDMRYAYLGALLGYSEQVFTRCVLETVLLVRTRGWARVLGERETYDGAHGECCGVVAMPAI
jgi:hypothetical protein